MVCRHLATLIKRGYLFPSRGKRTSQPPRPAKPHIYPKANLMAKLEIHANPWLSLVPFPPKSGPQVLPMCGTFRSLETVDVRGFLRSPCIHMHTRAMYNAFGLSNVLTKSSRTCLAWWIVIVVHAEYWVCVVCPPAATGYDSTDHTTSRQKCVLKHIRRICVFRTKCTKIIAVLGFKTRSLWHNVSILLVPWCIAAHSTTILCLAHPCLPLCLVNPEVNMSNTHGASIREREFILRGLSVAVFKSEPFDAREANDALHAMQYCSPCNPFTNESNEKNDRGTVVNETYRKFFFKEIGALLPPGFDISDLGLSTFHVEMLPSDDESERKAVASFRLYFPPSLFTKVFPWGSPLSVDLPRVTILSADGRPDGVQLSSNLFPKTFKRGAVRAFIGASRAGELRLQPVDEIETIRWNSHGTADLLTALLSQTVVIDRSSLPLPHSLTYSLAHAPIHTPPTRASQFAPAHIISHPLPHSLLHTLNPTYPHSIPPTPSIAVPHHPPRIHVHILPHTPTHTAVHMCSNMVSQTTQCSLSHTHTNASSHTPSHTPNQRRRAARKQLSKLQALRSKVSQMITEGRRTLVEEHNLHSQPAI